MQYQSRIFYYDSAQYHIAQDLIALLQKHGRHVATQVLPVAIFWPAEMYHQDYYAKNAKAPYCHTHRPVFSGLKKSK